MAEDLSPSDIRTRKFTTVRRGFDRGEVGDFLTRVGGQVETLQDELSAISTRLNQLGITDLVDLKEEIEDVGLEIQNILDAAMAAAEGLRARAASAADDTLIEADKTAFSLRGDAWASGSAALEDATSQAQRTVAEAREDALFIRAQAEQDAKRLVTQARREADDLVRSSREEGERIVVVARAESESILEETSRAAEKAQERARALENRRVELLSELEEAETAIRDIESSRSQPVSDLDDGVRVFTTGGDDQTRWPESEGAVRILPASPHESDGPEAALPEPVDAEAMAAEVEMMRSAVTLPQPVDPTDEFAPSGEPVVDEAAGEEVRSDAPSEDATSEDPPPEDASPEDESPEDEPAEQQPGDSVVAETPLPATDASADEEPEPEDEASPGSLNQPEQEETRPEEPAPAIVDKVTVVSDDPGIDDLFARLRHSVEEPAEPETRPEPIPDPEPEPTPPPVLHVVPDVEPSGDFERRDRMLLPIENRGLRGLKRRIVELQNRVLEELRKSPGEWRLGREHVSETMGEELDAVIADSYQAGHTAAAEVLGKAEPQLLGGPQQGAAETFTADLHRDVQSAIDRGDPGSRRLTADVGRVFRNWRTDEAERHVREAARRAFNDGLLAGYKRLGVKKVEVAEPGRPCGQCSAGTGVAWDPGEAPPDGVAVPPADRKCAALIVPIATTGSISRIEQ